MNFKILNWELDYNSPSGPKRGNGDRLSQEAMRSLAQIPRGTNVTIEINYQDPEGKVSEE